MAELIIMHDWVGARGSRRNPATVPAPADEKTLKQVYAAYAPYGAIPYAPKRSADVIRFPGQGDTRHGARRP